MRYSESVRYLRERAALSLASVSLPEMGLEVKTQPFRSRFLVPKGSEYQGLSPIFRALLRYYLARNESSNTYLLRNLEVPDDQVEENTRFRYPLVLPQGTERAKSVILLLHGLNERSWDKYLPWACRLAAGTGSAVILFPLSFHMNRAPESWADPRVMHRIARERKELFPDLRSSSFANAAISTRLQLVPQRLCYSGLQSMKDLGDLAAEIRSGAHPHVAPAARIDIFGYSIGGMIGELLLLGEGVDAFSDSRLLLFCGGATLDLSNPVSRSILDSEALHAVEGFYGMDFAEHVRHDERLSETLSRHEREAAVFSLLMHSEVNGPERRSRFRRIRERIRSICLSKDAVIPPLSVLRAVNGDGAPRPGLDDELDFPFAYSHEVPFPVYAGQEDEEEVDRAFDRTFEMAARFLA